MNPYSETATLPGAAVSTSDRGRGPVLRAAHPSEPVNGDLVGLVLGLDDESPVGFLWKVIPEALARAYAFGPCYRWTLVSGHVVIDSCPDWHAGTVKRCEHVEDMERLSDARESLRRMGASGVRS